MLKYIYYFGVVIIILFSCKTAEPLIVESKNYNIVIIKFTETNIESVNYNLYSKNDILITSLEHSRDFNPRSKTVFYLVKKGDTMRINCFLPEYNNYYLKNMKFRKGRYALQYKNSLQGIFIEKNIFEIEGKNIETSKLIQGILFKNFLVSDSVKGYAHEDLLFKNLKYKVIDFSDTTNVILMPIRE